MKAEVKTNRYVTCPNGCRDEFLVEHLFDDQKKAGSKKAGPELAGPWYCNTCGHGWDIQVLETGEVLVERTKDLRERKRPCWVILEIPPQTQPIRLKVRGMYFSDSLTPEEIEYKKFYYEEYTCPKNYFHDVEQITVGEEDDPHGLAKFVDAYDVEKPGAHA